MTDWFQWYVQQTEKKKSWAMYRERYLCPCCFMPTLSARADYVMCDICDWEDDGQDSDDADVIRGGPNGDYSLREARHNFKHAFSMYRPSDTHPYEIDQTERPFKEQLYRILADAMESESDEQWQRALAAEREMLSQRDRQERGRH